ncbi:MAG: AraC family transcriptional regulator [Clostridia bacterium]|nr:AraC family transcriptional regulator [Clostridia bacterium]
MINQIKNEKRYHFPVKWIFPNPEIHTVSAFVKKGFNTGFHVQYFYEIVLVISGEGYHFIGNETIRALPGDCFVVPPGVRHAFKGSDDFDVWHFHFSPAFFDKFLSVFKDLPDFFALFEAHPISGGKLKISPDFRYRYIPFEGDALDDVKWALHELTEYIWHHVPYTPFIAECKAAVVIYMLCSEYSKLEGVPKGNSRDDFFIKSISVLDEKSNEAHPIDELASIAMMSRTTYVKKFRERTGSTPKQLLLEERIKKAKKLLSSSENTVIQIAEAVGFYDVSHFVKTFKKKTGLTPTEYRKEKGLS